MNLNTSRERRHAAIGWTSAGAIGIVMIFLASALAGAVPAVAKHSPSTPQAGGLRDEGAVHSTGAAQLAAARASLGGSTSPSTRVFSRVASVATGPAWTEINASSPGISYGSSAVWDALDKEYVVFGGSPYATVINATWTLSTKNVWTELSPTAVPPARDRAGMAYDSVDKYVVLFGGVGSVSTLSDTWTFANGKWTNVTTSGGPPALLGPSMTFDATDGYVLLFGGMTATGTLSAQTWKFSAGTWTQLTPTNAPTARVGASMAFDAKDGYAILFGGENGGYGSLSDSWDFSGGNWHVLNPRTVPPARAYEGIGYDPNDGRIVMFGGVANATHGTYLSDTWLYVAGSWTKKGTFVHASNRAYPAFADGDSSTIGFFLFGGLGAGLYSDTWSYEKGVWSQVLPATPQARAFAMMAWDDKNQFVLLFGGANFTTGVVLGDTWKFVGGVWIPLHPKLSPSPRYGGMMAYDPIDGMVLLFGGVDSAGNLPCGTWGFKGSQWTEVISSCGAEPISRAYGGMTYDAYDGYVLLCGGYNTTLATYLSDTWGFSNGAWSSINTGSYPMQATEDFALTYDSADGYVVLFGGYTLTGSGLSQSTWVYQAGSWGNVTGASYSNPVPLAGAMMTDDGTAGYSLLYGGVNYYGTYFDAWSYSAHQWTFQTFGGAPPVEGGNLVYDPVDGYDVLFGGFLASGYCNGETWAYTG
jgi:hypothetical protein